MSAGAAPRIDQAYDYLDADRQLLFQVVRFRPKDFRQRRPGRENSWIWNLKGVQRVPYQLPELLAAPTDACVFVVEGEKDADTLSELGLVATTNAGGAGKWPVDHSVYLRGRRVAILPDNDEPGQAHAKKVASAVTGVAAEVRVITLPQLPVGGDVSDWLKAGGTPEQLLELVGETPLWESDRKPGVEDLSALTAYTAYRDHEQEWPGPIGTAALHGLAGRFVRLIEPHTEADPVAILAQFLVGVGSRIGRDPYFPVESDQHHCNLFVTLVGDTAKGRKGTSWRRVRDVMERADASWGDDAVANGLSSGEGLIWAVRDRITKQEKVKKGGRVIDYQNVIDDPGVDDKRLLVVEEELASTLRVMGREGNILSPLIRSAWDSGTLRILTKNAPAKATGAHISIIGHVTRDELVRYLDRTEMGNGFANRFLWMCVRRSKCLPDGGNLQEGELFPIVRDVATVLAFGSESRVLHRSEAAAHLWREVYEELSEGSLGLFGAVTSRAEAQVTRLSCLYALLDRSPVVEEAHLKAALAVWNYAEDSARYIFGDSIGDPVADTILRALRQSQDGLTRNSIRELFGRNKRSKEIDRALATLVELGLAHFEKEETDGRPAERWFTRRQYAVYAVNAERSP